jgi:hypothetical protein
VFLYRRIKDHKESDPRVYLSETSMTLLQPTGHTDTIDRPSRRPGRHREPTEASPASRTQSVVQLIKFKLSELPEGGAITTIKVTPAVIAAHEAGHALAAILFGAAFSGIKIKPEGHASAQVLDVSGLSDLGKARTFLSGSAGERFAFGEADLQLSEKDRSMLLESISDYSVLEYADPRADALMAKYGDAHTAIRDLILTAIVGEIADVIPTEVVLEVAERHGAAWGAEELGATHSMVNHAQDMGNYLSSAPRVGGDRPALRGSRAG